MTHVFETHGEEACSGLVAVHGDGRRVVKRVQHLCGEAVPPESEVLLCHTLVATNTLLLSLESDDKRQHFDVTGPVREVQDPADVCTLPVNEAEIFLQVIQVHVALAQLQLSARVVVDVVDAHFLHDAETTLRIHRQEGREIYEGTFFLFLDCICVVNGDSPQWACPYLLCYKYTL